MLSAKYCLFRRKNQIKSEQLFKIIAMGFKLALNQKLTKPIT